ncbi:restriction endonuclease subunit S [Nonomuraea coxensis]|nr:restriction endonuclease subunit S [Nonomuraea coxensis]
MRTRNIQTELDLSDVWSISRSHVKRPEQILQFGDVLVSSANSWNLVGKCCWTPQLDNEATFGGFITALRADPARLHPRYLYWWFSSPTVQAAVRSFGRQTTNISNLDIHRCLALNIPVPPLEEQRRLAGLLDQVDDLRAKRQQAIALLDDLAQSIFLDMFGNPATNPKGWVIRTVSDLIESATYGTSQKAHTAGDFPVLRMGNLTAQGRIDLSSLKYLPTSEVGERHIVRKDDILFNRTNSADLVGKTAVFRENTPMAYAGYLVRVRTNPQNHPEYISAFLNSRYGKKILRNMCKSIVGMANINARELQSIRIPAPPLKLQQEFAQRLQATEQQRAAHVSHLEALDELFSSLQAKAFRGEL